MKKAVIRKQKPLLCKERWRAERVGVVVALSLQEKEYRQGKSLSCARRGGERSESEWLSRCPS